jgi:hypothetical protein
MSEGLISDWTAGVMTVWKNESKHGFILKLGLECKKL